MAFLCVSQQGEFKNTKQTFWGKSMSKTLAGKVENSFSCHIFPSIFLIAFFGRFSA
jgi:hypothetical protein